MTRRRVAEASRIAGNIVFLLGALVSASPPGATAQTRTPAPPVSKPVPHPTGKLSIEQATRLALEHNPSLASAAWHLRSAQQHTRAESRLPNPTLDLTAENFGGDLGSEHLETTASLSQLLELGGKRGARASVARSEERVAAAELTLREREVVAETQSAFLTAWWLERRLELVSESERVAEAAIEASRERTRIGAAPPVDALRGEGILAERRIEGRDVAAQLDGARRQLALQWGASTAEFDSLVLAAPSLPTLPPADSLMAHLRNHPDRLRAAAETAVQVAHVREANASRVPDLTLTGGARRLKEADATGLIAGVSLPLPLWNRYGSQLRSAEAERSAASLREQSVERLLETELRTAYDSLTAARDKDEIVRTQLLPAARQALAQLQRGYRAGRFTYLDQVEGQRAALDAELTAIQVVRDFWIARFALERLLGNDLDAVAEEGR